MREARGIFLGEVRGTNGGNQGNISGGSERYMGMSKR